MLYARGLSAMRYRLLYSLLALLLTAVWLWFVQQLPDAPLYAVDGLLWSVMVGVQLLGLVIAIAAFQPIDGMVFLGLRQAAQGSDPFVERGIYRYLRHPMYSGAMLILLCTPEQSWNGLHLSLVVCLYFIIGARFEEGRMRAEHDAYAAYCLRVPAFIPRFNFTDSE